MQNSRRSPRKGAFRILRIVGAMTLISIAGATHAQTPTVSAVSGRPALLLGAFDLASLGYRSDEFFLSGTASSYQVAATGTGAATVAGTAPFVTRFVVTRPIDPH